MTLYSFPTDINLEIIPAPTYAVMPQDKDAGAHYYGQKRPVYKLSHEPATDYQQSVGIRTLPGYLCDMVFLYAGMLPSMSNHDAKVYGLMILLAQLQEHVEGHFDIITEILGIQDTTVNYAAKKMGMDTVSLPWLPVI